MPKSNDKPECRVLQVFSVLGIGGAETWLISLLKHFNQIKEELPVRLSMDICLTGGRKAELDEEAASLGAKLFYLNYCRKNLPFFIREFRSILAEGRYHAIHDHQDYTAGWHFLMGLGHLSPVRIAHIHNPMNIHIQNYNSSILRRMTVFTGKKLLSHFATHIMGTSRQVVTEYGCDSDSFKNVLRGVAHCGFDVTRFLRDRSIDHKELCEEFGFGREAKILLFVGRLISTIDPLLNQKNPEFALDVARHCINSDPSVRLLMAGSGEEMRRKLESRVSEWGLQDKIRLIGPRTDIPRLMSGSGLLLFPSLAEGLGMVAVEAQASGLRVLASDATPRECAVVPGMVKFMPLSDGANAWADTTLEVLKNQETDGYSCNDAVRESQFSIENSAKRLLDLYTKGNLSLKAQL